MDLPPGSTAWKVDIQFSETVCKVDTVINYRDSLKAQSVLTQNTIQDNPTIKYMEDR